MSHFLRNRTIKDDILHKKTVNFNMKQVNICHNGEEKIEGLQKRENSTDILYVDNLHTPTFRY
jgi:hypothetical protein